MKTLTASNIIKKHTKEYGKSVIDDVFPNPIDGLKKVHRRIIWSIKDHRGRIHGSTLISEALKLHPHGDQSIYDAASKIGQSFRMPFPLLNIEGGDGSYGGDKVSSSRYNYFRMSEFCRDVYFTDIDTYTFPKTRTEDLLSFEPVHLIPKVPMALILGNNTVGFGFSSTILPIKFEDVCDIVEYMLEHTSLFKSSFEEVLDKFVPYFPIWNRILNRDEVIQEYSTGNMSAPVIVEGKYELLSSNKLMIYTAAYGIDMSTVSEKLIGLICNRDSVLSKYQARMKSLSNHHNFAKLQIECTRSANIFELLDQVKRSLSLHRILRPVPHYSDHERGMRVLDQRRVAMTWLTQRLISIRSGLKRKQQKLKHDELTLETHLKVKDHIDEVIAIVRKVSDDQSVYLKLVKRFDLSLAQAKSLVNSKLISFSKKSVESIKKDMELVHSKLDEVKELIGDPKQVVANDIVRLRKKFKTDTTYRGWHDTYQGILVFKNKGYILVKDRADLYEKAALFPNADKKAYRFDGNLIVVVTTRATTYTSIDSIPYAGVCKNVLSLDAGSSHLLLGTRIKPLNKLSPGLLSKVDAYSDSSRNGFVITKTGEIIKASIGDTKLRNAVFIISPSKKKQLVFSINTAEKRKLRVQLVEFGTTDKLIMSYDGEQIVLGACPIDDDEIWLSMPKDFRSKQLVTVSIPKVLEKLGNSVSTLLTIRNKM